MDTTELGTTHAEDSPESKPQTAAGGKGASRRGRGGRIRRVGRLYKEVVAELRKVIWPTRRDLVGYTVVVLAFVIVMVLIVAGMDIGFSKAVLAVFG